MARNNGLSLVAKLNISLSESQISEDLKKISSNLDGKGLPSFIAHLNLSGSASAINKELAELGKKLKVDFGNITNSNNTNKLKQVGKNIAQSIYNVQELKKAGRDYIYNENNIQNQIDKLQSRYDKRSISLANTVNVKAVTDEIGKVKALTVEYQNLENQMVRVNYIKAKFDNKKVGFVSTGAVFADSTEGKGYQQTLDFLNKIEASFRRINNQTVGYSSPIKEGSVFYDEYNAKAQSVANSIMKIRESSKVLSVEQKTNIRSIINDFEAYSRTLKESAKGAESLAPKNLDQSVKQGNAELNTMLKNLSKNSQGLGYLKNKFTDIISEINKLRVQLNSVKDNAGFTQYSADLKLVKENIRQFNAELSNNKSQQKLKSEIDGLNAKIISFIKENNNLTDTYKRNLLDLAKQANAAKTSFELKGISGQFNALSNAFTNSENLSRSIRTLNNSLTVSEQKLLEMQGNTAGLDIEFQRVVDRVNKVRTDLSTVSTQSGFKNIKIDAAETKQAINDLYNTWKSRHNIDAKVATSISSLETLRQSIIAQKGDVGNLDGQYKALLAEIDRLKASSAGITSADQFVLWNNELENVRIKYDQLKNSIKSTTEINQLSVQAANLSSKINLFISQNTKLSENAKQKLRELANQAEQAKSKMELNSINTQFSTFTNKLKEADKLGTSIFSKLATNAKKFTSWFGMTTVIMRTISLIRNMINNVKELDTAMTNLKKVTDETDQTYKNFFESAGKSAQELHADMTNLIDATAEFAKLGYNIGQAEELAKIATVYKNVGELESIEDATSSIVSTIKAFKEYTNEVEAATKAVDAFNAVGNTEAVSSADLGEILRRSASAMASVGSTMNETIAIGTAANTIVQDSAMIGTSLKTMALRLTSTKVELQEMGEETEYAAECISDYRDKILALTANTASPVDILGDDGTYKKPYEMLKEISSVWKDMNNMEHSALLKLLFGVRQANAGAAILENFQIAERALATAETSAGSAMQEQERWAESLQARINQVNSSVQQLSTDVFNTDSLKRFVSSVNDIVINIDKVVKIFDVSKIAIGSFIAWILKTKNIVGATMTDSGLKISLFAKQWTAFGNSASQTVQPLKLVESTVNSINTTLATYNSQIGQTTALNNYLATSIPKTTMQQYLMTLNGAEASLQGYCVWLANSAAIQEDANIVISRYQSLTGLGANAQAIFRAEIAKTNPAMAQYLANTDAAAMSVENYERGLRRTELATRATTIATQAFKMAINLGVTIAITGLIQLISNAIRSYDNLIQKTSEIITNYESEKSAIEDLKKSYIDLINSNEDESVKQEKLKEIKKQLVEQYGFEAEKISEINKLRAEGISLIEQESRKQKLIALSDIYKGYNKAIEKFDGINEKIIGIRNWGIAGNDFIDTDNIRKEIQDLFDFTTYNIQTDNYTITKDALGFNEDNFISYYNRLKSIITEMENIKFTNGEFTTDEQFVYNELIKHYEKLSEKAKDSINVIENGAKLTSEIIYDSFKDLYGAYEDVYGTDNYKQWYDNLISYTKKRINDDEIPYVKWAFEEMFNTIKTSIDSTSIINDKTPNVYSELLALILKAKQGLSDLDGETNKAAESIDELLKLISDNKDSDKFFSSKEIIEFLDKYPELTKAIEVTQYGYKLNEKALQDLKDAKLKEAKATLQAELDKSKIVLNQAKKRLETYQAEISARNLLANVSSGIANGGIAGLVDSQKPFTNYVNAVNKFKEAESVVNKIQAQIDIMGTEFEDISDSTADTKANLSDQKDILNDMNDDLKDAQKDIEDLVKLTMDMIKKQKELEKETLKEKLDAYKKSVDLKKQELELEKDIHDFQKDLTEKNNNVIDLKQKIDALSIDGVDYSLEDIKRRNELEEEYAKAKTDLEDFLYENEIDTRKDALDKESDMFEDFIDTQTKAIEDYLDKEGLIRQDAIDLINGKTQEFYNDLFNYTLTYTDKSEYEFNKLWNSAYDALSKYGNGQIDVLTTLAYLDMQIAQTEFQIKSLEATASAASNSTKNGINATREAFQFLNHEIENSNDLLNESIDLMDKAATRTTPLHWRTNGSTVSSTVSSTDVVKAIQGLKTGATSSTDVIKLIQKLPKYHDGGVVNGKGEVFAKLMSGEVVSTQRQAETFLTQTLPNLIDTGTKVSTNNTTTTSLSLGNIIVNGNANQETVNNLKNLQKEIAENIFSKINSQFRKTGIKVSY